MNNLTYQQIFHDVLISTDKALLNVDTIHHYLSTQSYWALNITMPIVERAIENALCFGVYKNNIQVGFARLITDKATIAYLADVFIIK